MAPRTVDSLQWFYSETGKIGDTTMQRFKQNAALGISRSQADRQRYGIQAGRRGVTLKLTADQLARLKSGW